MTGKKGPNHYQRDGKASKLSKKQLKDYIPTRPTREAQMTQALSPVNPRFVEAMSRSSPRLDSDMIEQSMGGQQEGNSEHRRIPSDTTILTTAATYAAMTPRAIPRDIFGDAAPCTPLSSVAVPHAADQHRRVPSDTTIVTAAAPYTPSVMTPQPIPAHTIGNAPLEYHGVDFLPAPPPFPYQMGSMQDFPGRIPQSNFEAIMGTPLYLPSEYAASLYQNPNAQYIPYNPPTSSAPSSAPSSTPQFTGYPSYPAASYDNGMGMRGIPTLGGVFMNPMGYPAGHPPPNSSSLRTYGCPYMNNPMSHAPGFSDPSNVPAGLNGGAPSFVPGMGGAGMNTSSMNTMGSKSPSVDTMGMGVEGSEDYEVIRCPPLEGYDGQRMGWSRREWRREMRRGDNGGGINERWGGRGGREEGVSGGMASGSSGAAFSAGYGDQGPASVGFSQQPIRPPTFPGPRQLFRRQFPYDGCVTNSGVQRYQSTTASPALAESQPLHLNSAAHFPPLGTNLTPSIPTGPLFPTRSAQQQRVLFHPGSQTYRPVAGNGQRPNRHRTRPKKGGNGEAEMEDHGESEELDNGGESVESESRIEVADGMDDGLKIEVGENVGDTQGDFGLGGMSLSDGEVEQKEGGGVHATDGVFVSAEAETGGGGRVEDPEEEKKEEGTGKTVDSGGKSKGEDWWSMEDE